MRLIWKKFEMRLSAKQPSQRGCAGEENQQINRLPDDTARRYSKLTLAV